MSVTSVLAIDPGNELSAYAQINPSSRRALCKDKVDNQEMRRLLRLVPLNTLVVVEQIAHYGTGMPAGRTVFDTCRAIGRFEEIRPDLRLILRTDVKVHFCGQTKAKDGNVRQALIDRFGDKGTKNNPGWFYGFKADIWQAYALAVYVADTKRKEVAA